ncbi:MAG: hypothetical protein KJ069_01090 [Anaerolineae bacterium]|nr:hypothetical protein [Anaerolineae bacterium]
MRIFVSHRFQRAYRKGSPGIQHLAEHAIHDFVRSYRSDPHNTVRRYDRVAHIRKQVLEIDISGKNRLLAHFAEKQLTLLDVGEKRIVPDYSLGKLEHDLANRIKAPDRFWPERPSGFFTEYIDPTIKLFGLELLPDWIYWLDEEQDGVLSTIAEDLDTWYSLLKLRNEGMIFFVVGGPGTGKSCVLINLLKWYVELKLNVGLSMSQELVEYVERSNHASISQYLVNNLVPEHDVLLVDDPKNMITINHYIQLVGQGSVKLLVLAFDPLQLEDSITDKSYYYLINTHKVKVHARTTCYRQKEKVGQATKNAANVIAASTPFLAKEKIKNYREERSELTRLSNELLFRNPGGHTPVYDEATIQNVIDEVNRINQPGLLWKHWYNLLVVESEKGALRPECYQAINRVKAKIISLNQIESVKGLEFQHVFLFLERSLYEQIEFGFEGSGQSVYNRRRLLRIPFSRAKDSLVTFVLGGNLIELPYH